MTQSSYDGCTEKASVIDNAITVAAESLFVLCDDLDRLAERLAPVRTHLDILMNEQGGNPIPQESPTASRLRNMADTISSARQKVSGILASLEV